MTVTRTHLYPEGTPPGVYTVTATDGVNSAEFQLTILDATPNTVTVNPASIAAGGTVAVSGAGYPANSTGTATVALTAGGPNVASVAVTTDGTGNVAATNLVIPAGTAAGDYTVTITVELETGTTPLTVTAPAPPLPTPTGLTAGAITDTSIAVSWAASAGADGYVVEYRASGATPWTARPLTAALTDTITGLTAGTEYEIRVTAHDSTGAASPSAPSAAINATTTGGVLPPLTAPTGLAVGTPTDTTLPVTWEERLGAVGYVVRWAPTGTTTWTERTQVTALTDTITGLTAGQGYDIQVKAIGDGTTNTDSPYSATVTGTTTGGGVVLAAPAGLAAGTPTATTMPLTWTVVPNATAYRIQWKLNTEPTVWSTFGTEPTTGAVTITELTANTLYNFRVMSVGNGTTFLDSPYSTPVNATTAAA